jgi:hypothetical protein
MLFVLHSGIGFAIIKLCKQLYAIRKERNMNLFKNNKGMLIFLASTLLVLCCLMPVYAKTNEEAYAEKLAQLQPDDVDGHYQLGLWCLKNKLANLAQTEFSKVIELNTNHEGARKNLGYVKFEDQWVSSKEYAIIQKVIQLPPPKGVLDKSGADDENLPWDKARSKETEHFIVKTNLSIDGLNDICFVMECAYFNYQDLFNGFEQPKKQKLLVMVAKNHEEYQKLIYDLRGVNPSSSEHGRYISAMNSQNKSGKNHLLSYYNLKAANPLSAYLLHECVHYAMRTVEQKCGCPRAPTWLDEGWANYYEASRIENKRLATNIINQVDLPEIQKAINQQTYVKLQDFINRALAGYDNNICYPEGWSLIYFLLNGQGGKYKSGLQAYMEAWKKNKIAMVVESDDLYPQNKPAHVKLFETCMGTSIGQLEQEWKEYVLQLK